MTTGTTISRAGALPRPISTRAHGGGGPLCPRRLPSRCVEVVFVFVVIVGVRDRRYLSRHTPIVLVLLPLLPGGRDDGRDGSF